MVRKFITTLALGAFAAFASGSVASAADECTVAVKGEDNAVVQACKKGGIKEAKKVMKAMVANAKKAGKKWDCETCHKNQEDFALTADAQNLFKELAALQK